MNAVLSDGVGAIGTRTIAVAGPTRLTTALPHWFAWSPFAPAVRKQLAAQV